MEDKTPMQQLQDQLFYEKKHGYETISPEDRNQMTAFGEDYKAFLNACKTERECVEWTVEKARANGFVDLSEKESLKPGDKIYTVNTEKCVLFAVIGTEPVKNGTNIVAAHIDSPRLDLKQNPLYEDKDIAYFKTHYYGGLKKYQWLTIPLALHGVVIKQDGTKINIVVGEKEDDPVLYISDLLPHLGTEQMSKTAGKIIEGEKLNVVLGTIPVADEKIKEKVKLNIMKYLYDTYGITEKDFISADFEVVPAYKAKDVGLDRSLIGSYGQDDRVCAYTAFRGILDCVAPSKTAICYLVDKEEVGSMDITGMRSRFFEDVLAKLCFKSMADYNDIAVRDALAGSTCLSADVTAAMDPNFEQVMERRNSAYLNKGVALMKYSGARGKSGTNETGAEFVGLVTEVFDKANVAWQTCELGKVDEGGGGTVAQFLAVMNIRVIDCGVPLLSMHSPYEVSSKFDVYMAYKAYASYFVR